MSNVKTCDGAELFYKDWGEGPVIMFSHGWPLSADAWDEYLLYFASRGFRAIAHDRRGHGRSSQSWSGNNMDTYAEDLATLVRTLNLFDVTHVGHSTGGGEVARYVRNYGTKRVKRIALVGAIPPIMLKTAANPGGLPIETFDAIREGVLSDRSEFYRNLSGPFYGANRPGSQVSQGLRDAFWRLSMQVGIKAAYDCIAAFSESDHTEDLKHFDVPTLIVHGSDDQIVPIADAALLSVKLVKDAQLKVYEGAPHGLTATHFRQFSDDLLAFINS